MSDSAVDADKLCRANPEEVDREGVIALGDCPEHGKNTLATARVDKAIYIAECGRTDCDHKVKAPVVIEDGKEKVAFNLEPKEVPL